MSNITGISTEKTLRNVLSQLGDLEKEITRVSEVAIASGTATGGSQITIQDEDSNWEVNRWKDSTVEVIIDDVHYYRTVESNTSDTLTIASLPATVEAGEGDEYYIRSYVKKVGLVTATGDEVTDDTFDAVKTLEQFGGAIYENEDTAADDSARRFETDAKLLRDITLQVSGNDQVFGDSTNQRYLIAVGETKGMTQVDISTLYFKNASTGQNGTVNILAVEV